MSTQKTLCFLASISVLSLLGVISTKLAQAQSIAPAADGTGTTVTSDGQQFQIDGGTLSRDGTNLFHSFQRFGLSSGEIANFLSQPHIRNILGRVVGGDASIINGLVQVTGGNSNLYLMNPAGIVFGADARLNVPASFMATTANGIGFEGGWFNAVGNNNYRDLVGDPNSLAFSLSQAGSIVNSGNLAVSQGQTLSLIGGTTINTGTVSAPGGKITIAAVPGTSQVQLSQEGMVLSLKLNATNLSNNGLLPESLPGLITGGNSVAATGISVDANGQVWLTASNTQIPKDTGTTIVSGTVDASNPNSGQAGGTINILGEKVGLISANMNASGSNGGGTVLVGGDYQGQGTIPKAQRTFVSNDSVINADALANGNGGQVIVWAEDTNQFFGNISTRGGEAAGNGGFVEVSSKDKSQFEGTVDTSASNGNFGTLLLDPTDITITAGGDFAGFSGQVLSGDAAPTTITQNQLQNLPGNTNVVIQASNSITINPMLGGQLTFQPGSGAIAFQAGGDFTMAPSDTLNASGRNLTISGARLTLGTVGGGPVSLTATNGGISADRIFSSLPNSPDGGAITLNATNGNIAVNELNSASPFSGGSATDPVDGGNININVINGSFTAQDIQSNAGVVGFLPIPSLDSLGRGGNVTINATGSITVTNLLDAKSSYLGAPIPDRGGIVTLNGVTLSGSTFRNINVTGSPGSSPGTPVTNPGTPVTDPGTPSTIIGANGVIVNIGSTGSRTGAASSSSMGTPSPFPRNLAEWNRYQFQQQHQEEAAYRARQNQKEIRRTEDWIEWDTQFSEYYADWGRYNAETGNPESATSDFANADAYTESAAARSQHLQTLEQD